MNQISTAALVLALLVRVASAETDNGEAAYRAEIAEWRAERVAELRAADGYLNLAALYWLDDGRVSFGASADNDLVFPNALADRIGYLEVTDGAVTMQVNEDALVLIDRQQVKRVVLKPVTDGAPVPAQMGSLFWYPIQRAGKLGLRLHDLDNPALERLPPMPYFEIDRRFRVTGRLKAYAEPRQVSVGTVIDGLPYEPQSPGVIELELDD
ncbi:MAG: hypothetical protein AAFX10_02595, partial [Pseudomonadota bacterium]